MERRDFIKGIFGGIVGSSVIVQATDAEIAKFATGVKEGDPVVSSKFDTNATQMSEGEFVYDKNGRVLGIFIGYTQTTEVFDATQEGEPFTRSVRGLTHTEGKFVVAGPVSWARR